MITIAEINAAAVTEIVVQADRSVKWKRADGTQIHTIFGILDAFKDQGFKIIGGLGLSTTAGGAFVHAESIYTRTRVGLSAAWNSVAAELGDECVSCNGPGTFKSRLAKDGESSLVDTLFRAEREYKDSLQRLSWAKAARNEDDIECEQGNVEGNKIAVEMWTEDLALLRAGMSLEELETTAELRDGSMLETA